MWYWDTNTRLGLCLQAARSESSVCKRAMSNKSIPLVKQIGSTLKHGIVFATTFELPFINCVLVENWEI